MSYGLHRVQSPLIELEHNLAKPVAFIIVPLFALANAGVALGFDDISIFFNQQVTLGVLCGLIIGKPLGIFLAVLIAARVKAIDIPPEINLRHILGLASLAGIGFTMSIFIADLAFDAHLQLFSQAKQGIILGSLISAILGVIILLSAKTRKKNHSATPFDTI